jgi:hypothetical protein
MKRPERCFSRSKKHSALQNWGRAIHRRSGYRKACTAVARKMAVTMHKMLVTGECFRYARTEEEKLAAKASKAAAAVALKGVALEAVA